MGPAQAKVVVFNRVKLIKLPIPIPILKKANCLNVFRFSLLFELSFRFFVTRKNNISKYKQR